VDGGGELRTETDEERLARLRRLLLKTREEIATLEARLENSTTGTRYYLTEESLARARLLRDKARAMEKDAPLPSIAVTPKPRKGGE
jgi:hypothetical protein